MNRFYCPTVGKVDTTDRAGSCCDRPDLHHAICAHCLSPQLGYAAVGDAMLCHPDEGLDCYVAVTVKGHAMPCDDCMGTHRVDDLTAPFGELQATRREA